MRVVPRGDHAGDLRSMRAANVSADEIVTQVHVVAVNPVIYDRHRDAGAHRGSPGLFDVDVVSLAPELTEVAEVPLAVVQRIVRAICHLLLGQRFP